MQELSISEIEAVSGSGFWSDLGLAMGTLWGMGTNMQTSIDQIENPMLSIMSMGA